ncbi:MAG: DUF6036 family nucleotidyltransferase [Phycisphaerae bacterium]
MTRPQLEHIIRASAATADVRDIVVIGSQSILGSHPDAPADLTVSMEADVFPKDRPDRSILIDGAIGELSLFHQTFGYHAHGVDETTAVLPDGWRDRLVKVDSPGTMGAVGWCLDPHDLAVSKLAAGRGKDLAFVRTMLHAGLVIADVLRARLDTTPALHRERRDLAEALLRSP